jgi:hypothetical protein
MALPQKYNKKKRKKEVGSVSTEHRGSVANSSASYSGGHAFDLGPETGHPECSL